MKKIFVIIILSLLINTHHSFALTWLEKQNAKEERKNLKNMNWFQKKQYVIKERKKHKQECHGDDRVMEAETEFAAKAAYKKCVSEFRFDTHMKHLVN